MSYYDDYLNEQHEDDAWSILCEAVENNNLYREFDDWDLSDDYGVTIAHIAAAHGRLPHDFNEWDLEDANGWTVAHEAAAHCNLPNDFNEWELQTFDGWTVAHETAKNGHLPQNFNKWGLKDNNGWTVAHEAASNGNLPIKFDQWELIDNNGWSVAQEKKEYDKRESIHTLVNYIDTEITHYDSSHFISIANEIEQGHLPSEFNEWEISDENGWSIAHLAAKAGLLPEYFNDWHISDKDGWTVAHEAAKNGNLPTGFTQWHLKDKNRISVKSIYNKKIVSDKSGDLIFRYADLKKQLSLIESEIEQIKENIIITIKQIGNIIEFDDFILSTYKLKKWSYSPEIKELENIVRNKKREEIKLKKAKIIDEIDILKYKNKKNHENIFP